MSIAKNISKNLSGKIKAVTEGPSISLVTKGNKVILDGPRAVSVPAGNMVYMSAGAHYIESETFEEITIEFQRGQSARLLAILSEQFGMTVDEHLPCHECRNSKYVKYPAWNAIKTIFTSYSAYIRSGKPNTTVEQLKKMELLTLLAANPECCIQRCILNDSDPYTENFEARIRANIFRPLSIPELAALTNHSVTAFKAEFRRRFHEPPQTYIRRQRLAHARMLLISTTRPIAAIGAECTFSSPSHFIKLFGKEYGMTPAAYRKEHGKE